MLEAYWAFSDFEEMANLVEELTCTLAEKFCGGLHIDHKDEEGNVLRTINLTRPWKRAGYHDLIKEAAGDDFFDITPEQRRERWRALALAARSDLAALYALAPPDVAARKQARFRQLVDDLAVLTADDPGYSGYLAWARQANNAHLALVSAYQSQVPAFEALFHRLGGQWSAFHAEVARLAALPPHQRSF
jgi:predicted aminopeptidase